MEGGRGALRCCTRSLLQACFPRRGKEEGGTGRVVPSSPSFLFLPSCNVLSVCSYVVRVQLVAAAVEGAITTIRKKEGEGEGDG